MSTTTFDEGLSEFTVAQQQQLRNWLAKHIGSSVNISSASTITLPSGEVVHVSTPNQRTQICYKTEKPCVNNCSGLCRDSY